MSVTTSDARPRSARAQLRILIVEDHMLFAESLELVFSVEGYDVRRIDVPDNASSPGTLLSCLVRLRPRIVLLDLDLGGFGDGVRLIAPLARVGVNVVVVTASTDRARWGEAIRCGARTVLSKGQPLSSVLATVRRINEGQPVMTYEEREELLRAWHQQRSEHQVTMARLSRLTARDWRLSTHASSISIPPIPFVESAATSSRRRERKVPGPGLPAAARSAARP